MDALPVPDASIDLLWCEGAIYTVGFDAGLTAFRRALRPGGHCVVSDLVWNEGARPARAAAFWGEAYPDMATLAERVAAASALGFQLVATEVVEERAWWEEYYDPLEAWFNAVPAANAAQWAGLREEIDLRRTEGAAYDYVGLVLVASGAQPPATAGTIEIV
jgi:SAM-dependent methyltransferase